MAVTQCRGCGSFLEPGTSECPRCGSRLLIVASGEGAPRRSRGWIAAAGVLLGIGVVFVLLRSGQSRRFEMPPSDPPAPVRADLVIYPMLQRQYPDLRLPWRDHTGVRFVAVPDVFWRALLSSERKRLAAELDSLYPARDWVVITGRYNGVGEMAMQRQLGRWELLGLPPGGAASEGGDGYTEHTAMVRPRALSAQAPDLARTVPEAGRNRPAPTGQAGQSERDRRSAPALRQSTKTRLPGTPEYEVLFAVDGLRKDRTYGEVLIPELSPSAPLKEREKIARIIAEHESLDSLTLYSTREARLAHYSMDYADRHPSALQDGLVGVLEKGRFKPYQKE